MSSQRDNDYKKKRKNRGRRSNDDLVSNGTSSSSKSLKMSFLPMDDSRISNNEEDGGPRRSKRTRLKPMPIPTFRTEVDDDLEDTNGSVPKLSTPNPTFRTELDDDTGSIRKAGEVASIDTTPTQEQLRKEAEQTDVIDVGTTKNNKNTRKRKRSGKEKKNNNNSGGCSSMNSFTDNAKGTGGTADDDDVDAIAVDSTDDDDNNNNNNKTYHSDEENGSIYKAGDEQIDNKNTCKLRGKDKNNNNNNSGGNSFTDDAKGTDNAKGTDRDVNRNNRAELGGTDNDNSNNGSIHKAGDIVNEAIVGVAGTGDVDNDSSTAHDEEREVNRINRAGLDTADSHGDDYIDGKNFSTFESSCDNEDDDGSISKANEAGKVEVSRHDENSSNKDTTSDESTELNSNNSPHNDLHEDNSSSTSGEDEKNVHNTTRCTFEMLYNYMQSNQSDSDSPTLKLCTTIDQDRWDDRLFGNGDSSQTLNTTSNDMPTMSDHAIVDNAVVPSQPALEKMSVEDADDSEDSDDDVPIKILASRMEKKKKATEDEPTGEKTAVEDVHIPNLDFEPMVDFSKTGKPPNELQTQLRQQAIDLFKAGKLSLEHLISTDQKIQKRVFNSCDSCDCAVRKNSHNLTTFKRWMSRQAEYYEKWNEAVGLNYQLKDWSVGSIRRQGLPRPTIKLDCGEKRGINMIM